MEQQSHATLAERYGRHAARPRRAQLAVLVLLFLVVVVWSVWAGLSKGTKDITWQVDGFTLHKTDVVINFTLHRRIHRAVTCTFRARGRDGAVVGRGSLEIPVSRRDTVSSVFTLATSARPVTGEIESCVRIITS